jgi:hypothetical protein
MYPVFQICIPFGNTEEPACTKKKTKKRMKEKIKKKKTRREEKKRKGKGKGKGRSNTMVYEGGRETKK